MNHGAGATDCLDIRRVNPLLNFHKERFALTRRDLPPTTGELKKSSHSI
jgi:hypothetical protein